MAFSGAAGFNVSDDFPEWVVAENNGFRIWTVINPDEGRIASTNWACEWEPGINRAECLAGIKYVDTKQCQEDFHPDHWKHTPECPRRDKCENPNSGCSCGFYAYYAEEYWSRTGAPIWFAPPNSQAKVFVCGIIEGFGRCVIGNKGFRSSQAVISAFAFPVFQSWGTALTEYRAAPEDVQQRVRDGLRSRFPNVPIFDSTEQMFKVIPLTGRPRPNPMEESA